MSKTHVTKPADVVRKWYVVDASGKTLGRLSTEIARILRGKHKPTFQPHMDCGDYVIVVNAKNIVLTGNKINQKTYFRHSGWVGGDKLTPIKELMAKKPEEVIYRAVKGMLPKNTLGRQTFKKLHVYAGAEHGQQAQKPEILEIKA